MQQCCLLQMDQGLGGLRQDFEARLETLGLELGSSRTAVNVRAGRVFRPFPLPLPTRCSTSCGIRQMPCQTARKYFFCVFYLCSPKQHICCLCLAKPSSWVGGGKLDASSLWPIISNIKYHCQVVWHLPVECLAKCMALACVVHDLHT